MSKERAKKAGLSPDAYMPRPADEDEDDKPAVGKDGLTDEERARKRYERRQAERARARAKKNKKNRGK